MSSSVGRPTEAQRDAMRVFRLILLIKAVFGLATFVALMVLVGGGVAWFFPRAVPTVAVGLLVFVPWVERRLGRWHLAVVLGLDVLVESVESAIVYYNATTFWSGMAMPHATNLSAGQFAPMQSFFLLIPVVLLAWGYWRRGALLGSTWTTVLLLVVGLVALRGGLFTPPYVLSVALPAVLLFTVPFLVSVLAERERRQHDELEAAYEGLRRHTATVEQLAVSRERNRLARDLHDTLAHSLAAIAVQLEALRTLLKHDPVEAEQSVAGLVDLARRGLDESRQAIQELRGDPLDTMGLEGALRELLAAIEARTGLAAEVQVTGTEPDLTLDESRTLYRIAEEALLNVERHAAASRVRVYVHSAKTGLRMGIVDDGLGFDAEAKHGGHFGLTGMRERAAIIGATLEVSSAPGRGTEVWCSLVR